MALSPQIVQAIAQDGVKGDTLLGHLTRGDTVIPRQAPPAVHDIARQSMAAHGMDVNRFVAGAPGNHINPKTGLHSFEDGGDGGDGGGGGGGGEGGEGGGDGSGGGSGPSGGGDKSGGEVGSGGGAQGGDPSGGAGGPGDTGAGGGGGTGPSGGGDKSGGAVGSGGGAQTDSGPSDTSDTGTSSGTKSSTAAEEAQAQSTSGKTASQALLGVDFSDLGPAGKLAMGVVPGMTTLAGLNEMTAHGVDQPSNPGGNLSAADTGGVGMGAGGPSDPGASSGGAGSEHPASVQGVLNNQTVGGSNGGTAAPDEPSNPTKQQTPVTPTDPFTDLKAALAAAHGIDKSPTFTSGSDAEILNAILGPQRAAAEQQLQNAHMRGTLSDQGYNSAELGLGTQDQQANSRIGNISDNLLAAYQQKLDAYANQAVTAAGGTQQGSPWDVTPWQSGYNSLLSTLQGREKGDLLNLLPSGGSLYDIPTLLANAGNSQGLYNPGGSPIQQALSDQRGLGTTGVF